ncbi:MAG TPA: hypothetical protein VFL94_13410 [Actinomycetales bacterium]|nr:hypothetical protein [Actinomycetales bacterium]
MTKSTCRRILSYAVVAALAVVLTGCGDNDEPGGDAGSTPTSTTTSSAPSTTTSAPTSPSATTTTSSRSVAISVSGRKVTPPPRTVDLPVGETLTLTVTVDHDDELHVHGFDVEKELPANTPVTVTLTGKERGVFEVETHHPELRLLKIAVR